MKKKVKPIVFSKETLFQNSDFRVVEEKDQPVVAFHKHNFGEIVFIISGSGVHITEEDEYPLKPGDVFVINGAQAHGFTKLKNLHLINIVYCHDKFNALREEFNGLPGFNVLFDLEPTLRKSHGFKSKLHLNSSQINEITALLKLLEKEYNNKLPWNKMAAESIFKMIVIKICRDYCHLDAPKTDILFKIEKSLNFMKRNFVNPITLRQLAKEADMSIPVYRRIFKEITGLPPINFLLRLRIAEAARLLAEENLKVNEAAIKAGFNNQSYFVRTFKKVFGTTPKNYAKGKNNLKN
jgi:AraC-like DNA-binding protein